MAVGLMLSAASILAKSLPIQDLVQLAEEPEHTNPPIDPHYVQSTVTRVARWIPDASCIPQALVAQAWLARAGQPASMVIGFRRGRYWEGHAWLELEDASLLFVEPSAGYIETWRP